MHNSTGTEHFRERARAALADAQLQRALENVKRGFIAKRAKARARLPEFEILRDEAREIKTHTLKYLDLYLARYEEKVIAAGGQVHWARDAGAARQIVSDICKASGAKSITKGKSMITEEIGLNAHLERQGFEVIETDLGEYLIQIRGETPSHIIAPAVHLNAEQIEADFHARHTQLPPERNISAPAALVSEARQMLREKFIQADVGITGANFLIAETGQSVIVTNEGNGDLTQTLPRVHIVMASLEKVVPTLEDTSTLIRVLARSATGQEISTYTTFSSGPRHAQDPDGPDEFHVVLLDNGRAATLGGEFADMLRCIRCGACLNHCPIYQAVGGHAYGSVYPGPMGSVLTPLLQGVKDAKHLPHACTLCGRCEAVCPERIALPAMLRRWRVRDFAQKPPLDTARLAIRLWAFIARRPALYRALTAPVIAALAWLGRGRGRLKSLPFANAWTDQRDLPTPQGTSFQFQWRRRAKNEQP